MRRFLSILVVLSMLLTCIPVFAEDTSTTADEQQVEKITQEEQAVTDTQVNEIIQLEDEQTLNTEEEKIVNELDQEQDITKANLTKILKALYKYMLKRDIYYKRVLNVAQKIEKLDNKTLKKRAIIEFQKRYEVAKERDRKIHHKIEKVLDYIKQNKDKLTPKEKLAVRKLFKPLIEKYYKHRQIIIHIHNKIENLTKLAMADDIKVFTALADKLKQKGDLKKAKELYEKAIERGAKDPDTYKKAGEVLKTEEGNGPKVFVKGKRPNFDVKPKVKDGRTLVPLRPIAESLNADIQWDGQTKTITMKKGDKKIELKVDSKTIKVNGKEQTIDVPATVEDGRTLVPVRVVSETLDANVTYDSETQVIQVEDTFESQDQSIPSTEVTQTGLGSAEELVPTTTEDQAINEVTSTDESKVEQNIDSVVNDQSSETTNP